MLVTRVADACLIKVLNSDECCMMTPVRMLYDDTCSTVEDTCATVMNVTSTVMNVTSTVMNVTSTVMNVALHTGDVHTNTLRRSSPLHPTSGSVCAAPAP
jgi:hypothetical protein